MRVQLPRLCRSDGLLVSGKYWVPDAAFDYNPDGSRSIIGCNQIGCNACGAHVQQRRGYSISLGQVPDMMAMAKQLIKTESWDSIEHVICDPLGLYRVYHCACSIHLESNLTSLDGSDDHLIYGAQQPKSWKCMGHPALATPNQIYGLPLMSAIDCITIVLAVMKHTASTVDPLPEDEVNPEAFLISRLYMHLEHGPYRNEIDLLVKDFLTHKDPLYRSVACLHVYKFPESSAGPSLVTAYRASPKRFDGVKHPHHNLGTTPTLRIKLVGLDHQFQSALLSYLGFSMDPAALELVRELILKNTFLTSWGSYANAIGMDWISQHFMQIYAVNPKGSLSALLSSIAANEPADIMIRIHELKAAALLSEKEFNDEIPYGVKNKVKTFLNLDIHDPKSNKEQRRK